jgi:hypothetical protein
MELPDSVFGTIQLFDADPYNLGVTNKSNLSIYRRKTKELFEKLSAIKELGESDVVLANFWMYPQTWGSLG